MSQPKTTLQKPKPSFAMDRNFFLAMSLPRSMPSTSRPATLTATSSLSSSGSASSVTGWSAMVDVGVGDEWKRRDWGEDGEEGAEGSRRGRGFTDSSSDGSSRRAHKQHSAAGFAA